MLHNEKRQKGDGSLQVALTRDQMRWKSLPDDIREEARMRMHSFLLPKSDVGEHVENYDISPCKFSLEKQESILNAE